jgi:hypothetical protein
MIPIISNGKEIEHDDLEQERAKTSRSRRENKINIKTDNWKEQQGEEREITARSKSKLPD